MQSETLLALNAMHNANTYNRAYQSLKQLNDLAIFALVKVSSERDFAYWLYLTEHKEKLELLEKNEQQETILSRESIHGEMFQEFERGLKIGIEIGKARAFLETQVAILNTIRKRSGSFQSTIHT